MPNEYWVATVDDNNVGVQKWLNQAASNGWRLVSAVQQFYVQEMREDTNRVWPYSGVTLILERETES